jgi:Tol biopolymer transport system component
MIGQTLSHYRITAALGTGGMGEVYRATDTKLHREVAIKVLPSEVAQDPERLARFEREAHLLASLNHPNIAAIYGLEEAEGKPFLALELVEGEDLKERLARGAIPVDEALEVAEQIAEALEAAHNKGIVHRDLKPANVKLTPDGKVKVLDFGLAKAWSGEEPDGSSPSAALSQSPTLAHTGTVAGVILGTAAYMSPEQARGKPVDRRADVWSFGALLWEMLSGHALFAGETVTDVIAQVVTKEPDVEELPGAIPVPVRRLIARCLRKDPRIRLPDIGAARLELQDVLAGRATEGDDSGGDAETAVEAERRRRRERRGWLAVALALGTLAVGLAVVHFREAPPPRPPAAQFVVEAPEGWRFHRWGWPVPSPDGRQILFRAVPEGTGRSYEDEDRVTVLWTHPLEALTARLLAGTEHAEHPVWSPDGQSVAFFAGGEIRRLNLASGLVQRICALPRAEVSAGLDWGVDGTIAFSIGGTRGEIFTVSADGGDPQPFAPPGASEGGPVRAFPQFLPDGRQIGFVSMGGGVPLGFYVALLDDPADSRLMVDGLVRVQYAGGYAFFTEGTTLVAQPFDSSAARLTGAPVAVATSVGAMDGQPGIGWAGVSPGGTLAYMARELASGALQLTWVDRKGGILDTVGPPGDYRQIVLSPDERKVAVELRDEESGYDIWVIDVARGVPSRVTTAPGEESNPVWSPDGRSLVFSAHHDDGQIDLRRKEPRATAPETVLHDSPGGDFAEGWTPDGRTLLFIRQPSSGEQSVWALSPEGDGAEPVLDAGFSVDEPQVSPDGRWLAYESRESGRPEVYVEPFRREGERVRVSVEGGGVPKWRGDGEELFFVTPNARLMSVDFHAEADGPEVGLPVELFELTGFTNLAWDDYAPSADGQRFLVKRPVDEAQPRRMHVITSWPSLLESR